MYVFYGLCTDFQGEGAVKFLQGCSLAGLWMILACWSSGIDPQRYEGGRSKNEAARSQANKSSLALALGEFRTSVSDMLFIKTERYLHGGVAYVPHLTEKLNTVQSGGTDEETFGHENNQQTVIPRPDDDYRGWIGSMHREIKPWIDPGLPHKHADGEELIPWFRMMTLSDPHYVRGYTTGAYWLKGKDPAASLEFLNEGIQHNPDAFQIYLCRAFLYLDEARAFPGGNMQAPTEEQFEVIRKAWREFETATEHMFAQRPRKWTGSIADVPGWSHYKETDAMSAVQMLITLERNYGSPNRLRNRLTAFLAVMPDHKGLQRAKARLENSR